VSAPIKLDLGAGEVSPPGFVPLGRDHGSEIFPLPHADETVDEVYASHVLEHFPHGQIEAVLADWVRVLKKGGRLRVAVPDFAKIAQSYLDGNQGPHQSWLMGGQTDANDFHKAIFDRDRLRQLFAKNNLVLVQSWASEIGDCADVPISLNLEGYKPHRSELKVSGAMSVPRLGFMDNFFNCMEACLPCHVKLRKHGGAFWGQAMENVFERILEEDDADFILAIDYDSTFLPRHLARLMQVMTLYPEIDALAPIQSSRHLKTTLFTVEGADGNEPSISRTDLSGETMPVSTAHFGLTLISTEKLRQLPKPWFHATPSPNGDWHEGKVDDDIQFWRKWTEAGNSLHLANRVAIGHMELMVRWPDINLEVMYQSTTDFQTKGVPEGVWE
jgi:predicted SAM-dependent methyltransferase